MSREWAAVGLIYRGVEGNWGEILNPKFWMGLAPAWLWLAREGEDGEARRAMEEMI